jgi:hypothetical protein
MAGLRAGGLNGDGEKARGELSQFLEGLDVAALDSWNVARNARPDRGPAGPGDGEIGLLG